MDGYMDRQYEIDGIDEMSMGFVSEFQDFIQQRYKITSTYHWAKIITFFSSTDEEAFDRFYELLEEYLNNLSIS